MTVSVSAREPQVFGHDEWCMASGVCDPVIELERRSVLHVMTFAGAVTHEVEQLGGLVSGRLADDRLMSWLLINAIHRLSHEPETVTSTVDAVLEVGLTRLAGAVLEEEFAREHIGSTSLPGSTFVEAQDYIERHCHEPDLTPRRLCTALHVSLPTLQRCFQAHGHSIAADIRTARVNRALALLQDVPARSMQFDQVAQYAGFKNARSLRNAFATCGMQSPRRYCSALKAPTEQPEEHSSPENVGSASQTVNSASNDPDSHRTDRTYS
ncbi:AraC family transcriptional regulator [Pseudoclavibacter sp. CFCC 11306]|uniref:AraC family transcriptional regulator n=1 Tax=Pseudoclavibacter sp. CFCC 11306 TaxID=1564493 RepID=UPI0013010CE0|nr:helix-turn-helix domain-containing protein [Pseudoclavibacter sp. CFCC 11306]KAB1658156.1 AraC family transcriptional regulator [Pseudoclavibacter sp. CFCC 11306]